LFCSCAPPGYFLDFKQPRSLYVGHPPPPPQRFSSGAPSLTGALPLPPSLIPFPHESLFCVLVCPPPSPYLFPLFSDAYFPVQTNPGRHCDPEFFLPLISNLPFVFGCLLVDHALFFPPPPCPPQSEFSCFDSITRSHPFFLILLDFFVSVDCDPNVIPFLVHTVFAAPPPFFSLFPFFHLQLTRSRLLLFSPVDLVFCCL